MSYPGSPLDRPSDVVDDPDGDIAGSAGTDEDADEKQVEEGKGGRNDDTLTDAPPVTGVEPRRPGFQPLPTPETPSGEHFAPGGRSPSVPGPWVGPQHALKNLGRRARTAASRSVAAQKASSDGRIVNERLRHLSPRSVFKISLIFYSCAVLVFVVSTVALWQLARGTGAVDDTESFVTDLFAYGNCVPREEVELGEDFREEDKCSEGQVMVGSFELSNGTLFWAVVIGGGVMITVATAGTVFLVVLFNLLSDITGGVRYSVVREPLAPGSGSTSGRKQR